jgi:hypothetical protein
MGRDTDSDDALREEDDALDALLADLEAERSAAQWNDYLARL